MQGDTYQEMETPPPSSFVSIFFVHNAAYPFCVNPSCKCHLNQLKIAALLEDIREGTLTLREAADFSEGKNL